MQCAAWSAPALGWLLYRKRQREDIEEPRRSALRDLQIPGRCGNCTFASGAPAILRLQRASCSSICVAQLVARIGEVLDDRLAQGLEGLSARDVWDKLDDESRFVESVFSFIQQVMAQRRAAV